MDSLFPSAPDKGVPLSAVRESADARAMLAFRRSAGKHTLASPGPSSDQLSELLTIAARVPDHRRLEPWRFIVFEGEARKIAGDRFADIYRSQNPERTEDEVDQSARNLFQRAPTIVAVVSSPDHNHRTPVWEQELSAGAVCMTLLLAANAAGWASVWLSEWIAYDRAAARVIGLYDTERVAGFIYLGTATAESPERPRPDMSTKVVRWPIGEER